MNISKISDISFKAKFKVADAEYYTKEEWNAALKRAPKKTQQVLDFLFYMNSEQAKQVLNRLPKEDTVELYILKDTEKNVSIQPYLYYHSESLPIELQKRIEEKGLNTTTCHPIHLKSRFRTWAEQLNYFIQSSNSNKQ